MPVEDEAERVASVAVEAEQIAAWLDEQCDVAAMSDEEIDALVDEAIKSDAELRAPQSDGKVIHVPRYDDGLDDGEEDLKLYGVIYSK